MNPSLQLEFLHYTYTNRDQVIAKATPQGTLSYSYDLSGNVASVLSSNPNGTSVAYAWDADNRLSSVTDNRTSGVTNYNYDQTSQLSTMVYPNTAYNGDGNRVTRTTSGVVTRYLVDEQTPTGYTQVAEEIVGAAVTAQFTYGPMRIGQNRGGTLSYSGYDPGGSVRELLSGSGAVTDTYSYDGFGNTVAQTGSTVNEFLYRGEQFDADLNLYYLRARWYSRKTGRFVTGR